MAEALPRYSSLEEWANSLTHGIGAVLAIAGLIVMLVMTIGNGTAWQIVSASIYGSTLITMFLASTLYHAIQYAPARKVLRQADHIAILYLIAGSYTPLTLVTLNGTWGWSLFCVVWGLTVVGTVLQLSPAKKYRALMVGLYLTMGWVAVVAAKPLITNMSAAGLGLIVAGGLAYTGGVLFYANKRIPFNHAIWHLFVLAGAILHYFAILFYVL
ncbi:PAQR family membrane homeostasis protein TrhA [Reinekea marinisedimentorum]|uniref:Hemolysin III n=1 Tax=Reinekea marinisedimentorum TaxID=230495 RepID=A0A4R3HZQ6_9GAMM|nr:hemolysin III family protein [Reinekea marinisedimentorum]TCS38897.1 hemolysin III [Reinekea marinisedimentorum]